MNNNSHEANPADIQNAGQPQPVNQELVAALKLILSDAEAGNIQGMGFIRVARPGAFNVFVVGQNMLEIHAGAHLLMDGCKDFWKAQLQAVMQQAQAAGLQRATAADLDRLPKGFGRRQ
jgi:hypothetical protein